VFNDGAFQEWFYSGLPIGIESPEKTLRIAIARYIAKRLDFELPDDLADFIAENEVASIRQLEGAVKLLVARTTLLGEDLSVETGKAHLTCPKEKQNG